MTLGALSTAASDVVVDSIVVERARGAREGTTGALQSLCWAASAVGGVASAYFSGSLVKDWGVRAVFGATALLPLFVSASALLIDEPRVGGGRGGRGVKSGGGGAAAAVAAAAAGGGGDYEPLLLPSPGGAAPADAEAPAAAAGGYGGAGGSSSSSAPLAPVAALAASAASSPGPAPPLPARLEAQARALWAAVRRRDILLPTAFVFLWQATPTADSAMFYFYTNRLHFDAEFLGRVRLAGAVASLAGVALYNGLFKKVRRCARARMLAGCVTPIHRLQHTKKPQLPQSDAVPTTTPSRTVLTHSLYPNQTINNNNNPDKRCRSSACSSARCSSAPRSARRSCSWSPARTARSGCPTSSSCSATR